MASLIVDEGVSLAHILLSPPQLRQLCLEPHRRVACILKARHAPASSLPLSVVLHPIRELRPGVHRQHDAEVDLWALGRDELRSFFVSWLASQAAPASDTEPGTVSASKSAKAQTCVVEAPGDARPDRAEKLGSASSGREVAAPGVALETGSVLSTQSADGRQTSSFFLELTWRPGVPKESHLMLQSAQAFLQSGVPVELGPAVELPAVAKADTSGWQGQPAQSLVARQSAANGQPASAGAGAPLRVSGQTQKLPVACTLLTGDHCYIGRNTTNIGKGLLLSSSRRLKAQTARKCQGKRV